MPELRKDPIVERWVVLAPERARRPSDFRSGSTGMSSPPGTCPFCPGNESLTTPEILAVRSGPGVSDWELRVVPNLYPALRVEGTLRREAEGLFDRVEGIGAHEVVIETRHHDATLGDLPAAAVEPILRAWIDRTTDLSRDTRLRSVQIFENRGERAGASLFHPHSQIVALPLIPPALNEKLAAGLDHHRRKERCIWCDVASQERKDGTRVVFGNDACLVFQPWAPRAPFETWLVPTRHSSRFEDLSNGELQSIAEAIRQAVRCIDVALERPALNLMLHTGPLREPELPHFHWHLEILPATVHSAGLEIGAGVYINPVPPEEAARFLRGVVEEGS